MALPILMNDGPILIQRQLRRFPLLTSRDSAQQLPQESEMGCEGAAGSEFVQQAVARSYLQNARIIGRRGNSNVCRLCSAFEH